MLNLIHVGLHHGINRNAGDTLLVDATRRCFERFLGPINWTLHQVWAPFDAAVANEHDGVVVGGGGLLLPDQDGASYEASGWQWNCTIEQLEAIEVPLIVFGIGYNRFRGQEDFTPIFDHHIDMVRKRAAFFGVRESMMNIDGARFLDDTDYQPCPTTCLTHLYDVDTGTTPGQPMLAVNVASDRLRYRFSDNKTGVRTFHVLAETCGSMVSKGWQIHLMCHKPDDTMFGEHLMARGIPYTQVDLWDYDPLDVIRAYAASDMVIGMRGHAQLIPFGLRKRVVSVISHDKLGRFLNDIGHPEWGVDVESKMFRDELFETVSHVTQSPTMQSQIDIVQQQCWQTTCQNMELISKALNVKVMA